MGIARRKAGKISKAVTKSISKGGEDHVRKFDISSEVIQRFGKKRQNAWKNGRMRRKKFFYGVGTHRCVLYRTAEMRVTCVTPANAPKCS